MKTDDAVWRKSRRSGSRDACVEVASLSGEVGVRDSKNPGGPHLTVSRGAWRALTLRVQRGELDG